ncbi:MAG TPA: pirin-like C-terminal cupin domain-containing protein [Burkholderiales bacterium]|nr:pirin-like C-terminal cupin domain-containing protein [Burkholderiales bacterium]
MSGAPTREQIAPYGPFVMNAHEELMQAIDDLNNGAFVWGRKGIDAFDPVRRACRRAAGSSSRSSPRR